MSPERLEQLKQHIRNPSSASLNREWMLELVDEVERLRAPLSITEAVERILPAPVTVPDNLPPGAVALKRRDPPLLDDNGLVIVDDRPKAKKGGKK